MSNEVLWLIMLCLNFLFVLIAYRLFGRTGLYAWIPIAVIIANIQVVKTVQIFGVTSSLGNIVYATSFLATDILSENYGRRDAAKAVGIGFLALAAVTVFMNLALRFEAAPVDFAHESMSALYSLLPRIAAGSFIAYAVSQIHDVWIYDKLKRRRSDGRLIWLRNNLSTMISQAIDSLVFVSVAFAGLIPRQEFWQIAGSTYLFKWIVAAADTPLLYLASRWHRRGEVPEE